MKSRLPHAVAAALAAGTFSLAVAQAQPSWPANATQPSPENPPTLVQGTVASAAKADGPDADLVNGIVTALNADASLKDSKITVAAEGGSVTLTGATQTKEQRQKASEIATSQAGDGKVVNVIVDSAA